MRHSDQQAE